MLVYVKVQERRSTFIITSFHLNRNPLFFVFVLQGTIIIPNLSSVLNEEGQWKSPNEFNPENFLNEKGEFVKPEAFMPFSTGK